MMYVVSILSLMVQIITWSVAPEFMWGWAWLWQYHSSVHLVYTNVKVVYSTFLSSPISEYTEITCIGYQLVINQVGCHTLALELSQNRVGICVVVVDSIYSNMYNVLLYFGLMAISVWPEFLWWHYQSSLNLQQMNVKVVYEKQP